LFQRLKLKRDEPLSNVVVCFNVRRYTMAGGDKFGNIFIARLSAGAYTRPIFSAT
jgi:hypothetical protein